MKKSILRVGMMLLVASMSLTSCQGFWDDLLGTEDNPSTPNAPVVDNRIEEVVPDDIREKLEEYIPIYDGVNPPNVEGVFDLNPQVTVFCEDGFYAPGHVINPYYLRFFNQDMENNTIDYAEMSYDGSDTAEGSGSFISGTGNNFSIFFNSDGLNRGISYKTALVISGTKTDNGIKDLYYAFVMVEKGPDPFHYLMNEGVFRVFKDQDGLSVPTTWPGATRAISISNEVPEMIRGAYYNK